MVDVVTPMQISVPAGTTAASPLITSIKLGWSDVVDILIVFPPGCSGLVGARVEYGGNPVYPASSAGWYVLDDYVIDIPVTNQEQGGTWDIAAYNTDYYAHGLYVYFSWNYLANQQSPNPVSLVSL